MGNSESRTERQETSDDNNIQPDSSESCSQDSNDPTPSILQGPGVISQEESFLDLSVINSDKEDSYVRTSSVSALSGVISQEESIQDSVVDPIGNKKNKDDSKVPTSSFPQIPKVISQEESNSFSFVGAAGIDARKKHSRVPPSSDFQIIKEESMPSTVLENTGMEPNNLHALSRQSVSGILKTILTVSSICHF